MAARKKDAAKSKGRAGKTKAEKPAKAKKAKKAEVAVVDEDGVEVVEGGMSFEDAILVATGVVLILAAVITLMTSGEHYPDKAGPGTYEEWLDAK